MHEHEFLRPIFFSAQMHRLIIYIVVSSRLEVANFWACDSFIHVAQGIITTDHLEGSEVCCSVDTGDFEDPRQLLNHPKGLSKISQEPSGPT